MAYIGKIPATGAFQKCDALTASATADYTLQVGSTNVVPESVNHMIVSLNGVIQQPGATGGFTVSGSTLSFTSALTSNDTIDFVMLLGNVLDIGTPSDATVSNAKLASDLISGETDIGGAIADADLFLVDDGAGGTLRKTAASRIKTYAGGDLTPAFSAYNSAATVLSDAALTTIKFNTENFDTDSAFNTTNYTFTVPAGEGGEYYFSIRVELENGADGRYDNFYVRLRKDGSSTIKEIHYYPGTATYSPRTFTWELNCTATLEAADEITAAIYMDFNAGAPQVQGSATSSEFAGFKILGA